jgi:hypothetical protein
MDGGVAIGSEIEVVTQAPRAFPVRPRLFQNGYTSALAITVIPQSAPVGTTTAKLWIEPILASGTAFEITVTVTSEFTELSTPATSTPTRTATPTSSGTPSPTVNPYPFRAIAPGLGKDE